LAFGLTALLPQSRCCDPSTIRCDNPPRRACRRSGARSSPRWRARCRAGGLLHRGRARELRDGARVIERLITSCLEARASCSNRDPLNRQRASRAPRRVRGKVPLNPNLPGGTMPLPKSSAHQRVHHHAGSKRIFTADNPARQPNRSDGGVLWQKEGAKGGSIGVVIRPPGVRNSGEALGWCEHFPLKHRRRGARASSSLAGVPDSLE